MMKCHGAGEVSRAALAVGVSEPTLYRWRRAGNMRQALIEMLFGKLPDFFKDEAELRTLWSAPDTRKKLLEGLAEKGIGGAQLAEMQKSLKSILDGLSPRARGKPLRSLR